MKKFLTKIGCIILLVCVAALTLVGCSESEWKGSVTLKNSGAVIENGGFIAETENYLYFINGIESSTSKNDMGKPLKGALLVADKNDLSKTEVVVPKLMVASDYNAGVFIDGGYAYYATPSVEKNSEGQVANDELTFMRTKLDGSGKTDEFFTLDSNGAIAVEYRIVKGENGGVFIYYFDEENTNIVCYNTSTKKSTIVISQEAVDNGDALSSYYFLNSQDISDVVAFYTTTVYANKHEALYNKVYMIKAGSVAGELLVSGENQPDKKIDDVKYSISLIKDGYLFFTTTNTGVTENFAISFQDAKVSANWAVAQKVENTSYIVSTTLIISLSEIYVMGDSKVYKTTFIEEDSKIKTPVALKEGVNELLLIKDNYLYFYNGDGHIARILLDQGADIDDDKQVVLVSEDTAATTWYGIEVKTINGKEYLFYCDNSVTGQSYIKFVDLSADVIEKDTDGDDENDLIYLDVKKIALLGKMTDSDAALVFEERVKVKATYGPSKGIGEDQDDDQLYYEEIMELKAEYSALSKSIKDKISSTAVNTFAYIEKAYEVKEKYEMLDGIADMGNAEEAEQQGFRAIYEEIKEYMDAFKNSDERDGVDSFISANLKANYTKAVKLFETEE